MIKKIEKFNDETELYALIVEIVSPLARKLPLKGKIAKTSTIWTSSSSSSSNAPQVNLLELSTTEAIRLTIYDFGSECEPFLPKRPEDKGRQAAGHARKSAIIRGSHSRGRAYESD
jgi:hypothetical protein